ncbi:MAG: hypothetical protein PHX02_01085 [Oscillospiraceae bacterium]|nr:hypothetical protein [Oscillospiraceae bacterium]
MLLSILSIILMSIMSLYMINKAKFASTRRMALIPLCCVFVELMTAGLLSISSFWVLTLILIILRAVILISCIGELQRDAAAARRRAHRCAVHKYRAATVYAKAHQPKRCA